MKNILFIAGLLMLDIACTTATKESPNTVPRANENVVTLTDAQLQNITIETSPLVKRNLSSTITVNGKIDVPPQNLVSVSAPLGGYLKATKLLPGMHINKGEIIATMEDPQYVQLQQDYLLAKSALHFAELDYNRQRDLNQSQASSDKVMQQAHAEMNKQRINMSALAQKLRLININPARLTENNISKSIYLYSTINGYVSKIDVNIGKYVNPSDVLFDLINPQDIHLNLKVYEKDINKLFIGQQLYAYSNVHPEKKYLCEIILISKDITENGSTEVHCHFENYDKSLLPGLYMNAEIKVSSAVANALPEESIVHFEGKDYVFIQNDKKQYTLQPVTIGTTEDGYVEISGSSAIPKQSYVTKGAYTLLMKMKNHEEEE